MRDIANDYQENALRLLKNLSARHIEEKTDALTALRKASGAAFSIFSGAGHDMRILSGRLRDMNITDTDTTLRRPALNQKLDVVAQLCQTKLSSNVEDGLEQLEDDSGSELGVAKGRVDGLADTYRLKLCGAIRKPNDQTFEVYDKMNSEVDSFIERCVKGESQPEPVSRPEVKKTDTSDRTADEALEAILDKMIAIGTLREGRVEVAHGMSGRIIDVVAENTGMSDMEISV